MITADTLKTLTTFTPKALAVALDQNGYQGVSFKTAEFVGITNGGQFCYKTTYFDEAGTGNLETDKVFLTYDPSKDKVIADY